MKNQFGNPISDSKKIAALAELKPGDAHPDLGDVQNYLRRCGYFNSDETCEAGILCPATARVLKSFQNFFKIKPSGYFDETTRHAMSAPRCGVADFSELEARTTSAWGHGDITYTFGNFTSQAVGADAARNAIRAAFATWADTVERLTFREVEADDDPDIRVEWRQAADPDHNMEGGVLAHAEFPPSSSPTAQADHCHCTSIKKNTLGSLALNPIRTISKPLHSTRSATASVSCIQESLDR